MLLVITCLVGTFAGCSSSSSNDNETKEAVTTKKAEVTTTEAQTEEPTTEYVYKGQKFSCNADYANFFDGLTLNKGDSVYLNDIIPISASDLSRGTLANKIINCIGTNEQAKIFEEKYLEPGAANPFVTYDENLSFEYIKDESISFYLLEIESEESEDIIYSYAYFDVY